MGSCQSGLATSHTLAQVPQSADKSAQPTGSPQSTMPTGSAQSQDVQVPRILKKTVSLSREPPKAQTHLLADDKTKHVAIGMLGASSSKKFKPVLPQIPAAPTRKVLGWEVLGRFTSSKGCVKARHTRTPKLTSNDCMCRRQ